VFFSYPEIASKSRIENDLIELSKMGTANLKRIEKNRKIRVAIIEDDSTLLSTLSKLIGTDSAFKVEGGFPNTAAALRGIPRLNPDIVILDINLPDVSGVECARRLKSICPNVQILMLTVFEDTESVFSALRVGASGYLLKQTPLQELLAALREIYRGGSPMSSHVARKVVQSFKEDDVVDHEVESLSSREREVLELIAEGCLFKEIAGKLGVSFGTIHTYCRRIYEKLHVRSRAQAVARWHHRHNE
jgi:DNA-binding NarL/FixJ family response regulator